MMALDQIPAPAPLDVHFAPGKSDRLVVSLASVGTRRHKTPQPEFAHMTASIGQSNVLFISDRSRSWMNGPGVADHITRLVNETAERVAAGDIIALGNSMGGTAAMVLAEMTQINRVIALAPQYSAHPDLVPEETRWWFFRRQIEAWPHPKVPDLQDRDTVVTILHGATQDEWRHARRFPENAGYRHFIFPKRSHAVARELHEDGLLRPIVQAIIEGRPNRAQAAIETAGGVPRADFSAADILLSPKEAGHDEI